MSSAGDREFSILKWNVVRAISATSAVLLLTKSHNEALTYPRVRGLSDHEQLVRPRPAERSSALYELKHGTKTTSLDSRQITELEKGYIGKKVRLVVYEVGSFQGIPNQLPKDVPVWADFGFNSPKQSPR